MVTRRRFLGGLGLAGVGLVLPRPARATTAIAVTLSQLVYDSAHVVVGTSVDAFCQWERIAGKSRLVTYSLVSVERPLDGRATPTKEVMVRTLGGVLGDKGQIVHGEAVVALGEPAAIFLRPLARDLFSVTHMAQGHYPLEDDSTGERRLRAALEALELVEVPDAAVHRLHGASLPEAEVILAKEFGRVGR
ncbi:MAG TPA: twin-arginine translocation signal domain-containing protein [Polyangiaceae bacterium]|nr:twin-arginine translocation signal domain-containing protein [Polyangiaceae bacterium]